MMNKKIVVSFIIPLMMSCSGSGDRGKISFYGSMGELFQQQQVQLNTTNHRVERTIQLNGIKETKLLSPDSSFWVDEFKLFSPLLIHTSELRSNFSDSTFRDNDTQITSYKRLAGNNPVLRLTKIARDNGDLIRITADVNQRAYTYNHVKFIELNFVEGNVLDHYTYQSTEHTMFGDSTTYDVSAKVLY